MIRRWQAAATRRPDISKKTQSCHIQDTRTGGEHSGRYSVDEEQQQHEEEEEVVIERYMNRFLSSLFNIILSHMRIEDCRLSEKLN